MINSKYLIKLQGLISTKRMISNGIQVDLSDFNEVQQKGLLECYEHTLMEALDQVKAYKKEYPNMKYRVVNVGVCR